MTITTANISLAIVDGNLTATSTTQVVNQVALSNIKVLRGTHAPVGGSDITSSALATTALGVLGAVLEGVNSNRAGLGASMSRLEHALDNLQNVAQNTASART